MNKKFTTPDREENQMVKFSEMHYERPDMDTLKAKLQEAVSNISEAQSYEEVRRICFEIQEQRKELYTLSSIAHVRNTIDTSVPTATPINP